jgi:hypothetical protein
VFRVASHPLLNPLVAERTPWPQVRILTWLALVLTFVNSMLWRCANQDRIEPVRTGTTMYGLSWCCHDPR